jgi:hypothetical protein
VIDFGKRHKDTLESWLGAVKCLSFIENRLECR